MRILLIGNMNESKNGQMFYDITRKLVNGLIRNGHCLYVFSDRDVARSSNPFGSKELGRRAVNKRVLEVAENFRPDFILLCHADTLTRETVGALKAGPGRPKLALRNIDPLEEAQNVANIQRFADLMDAVFVTTAGPALKQFSHPGNRVAFMPNPVDPSVETLRAFETETPPHDVFFSARAPKPVHRVETCEYLMRQLPDVRFDVRGFLGKPPAYGQVYYDGIAGCRMGLSLDRFAGHLYASDRMAQYGGNGLLLLVAGGSGFERWFSPDEMGFYTDRDDLVRVIRRFKADDALARAGAKAAWEKLHAMFEVSRVTKWIVETTFRLPLSDDYPWPTETY